MNTITPDPEKILLTALQFEKAAAPGLGLAAEPTVEALRMIGNFGHDETMRLWLESLKKTISELEKSMVIVIDSISFLETAMTATLKGVSHAFTSSMDFIDARSAAARPSGGTSPTPRRN